MGDERVSLDRLIQEWRTSLDQAAGLARASDMDEAVARALVVYRATTDALVRANPHDRAIILEHVRFSRDELNRLRALRTTDREQLAARAREDHETDR